MQIITPEANMMVSRGLVAMVKNLRKMLKTEGRTEQWELLYSLIKQTIESAENLLPLTIDDGSFYLCEKDREKITHACELMRKLDDK